MQGYIKLYRKIRGNPIFNDMELFRLWMICLTEATHKERDQIIGRQTVKLMPGEFVTGRFDLETMFNNGLKRDQQKSPKTIWRWLESLESGQYLTIKSTNKYSVVAILNWQLYQLDDQENDQQVTNKRPTSDQQVTTNKNVKNVNNAKNEVPKTLYGEHVLLTDEQYQKLLKDLTEPIVTSLIDDINYWFTQKPTRIKDYKDHNRMIRKWNQNNENKKLTVINGGGNGGKYRGNARGHTEADYQAAERDSDLAIIRPSGVQLSELQRQRSDERIRST